MPHVSIDDIKAQIQPEDFDAITGGDEEVAETCLENAKERVEAAITSYGLDYDETDNVIRLAVVKMTMCELYSYSADWITAENYRDEASLLLKPLAPEKMPDSASVKGSTSWQGYN
jgi:hypothetical protein